MTATLLELPPELITHVFHHLDDSDFFAARLVGKHLERASFSTFGKRFFRKKGYMITTASLDVLQLVSSHEELRPYVQHVWFNPDCYTFGPSLFVPGHFDDWNAVNPEDRYSDDPETNRKNHEAHTACMEDHHNLLNSRRTLTDKFTTAFFSLPNLKTVGMRRSDQHSPWGWRTLRDAVGHDPRELGDLPWIPQSGMSPPTLLYAALIGALDTSGAEIQRLYTDAIEIDLISLRTLPLDVVQRACSSLQYLEVNVTKGNISTVYQPPDETTESRRLHEISQYGSGLIRLLSASPKLRELGLMIFPDQRQSHLMAPEEGWLESYPYLTLVHLVSGMQLQNLRRIKLEKFTTTPATLISLLRPSAKHVTSIKLRDIRLLDDAGTGAERPWESIFSFLATSCPKLSYLLLYHLSHSTGTIRFVENLPPPDANDPLTELEDDVHLTSFTDYTNISVEAGVPHSDPDTEGSEKRATIFRAREVVGERVRALVDGHWYGNNTFSYEMDEMVWHTDTSDEEW